LFFSLEGEADEVAVLGFFPNETSSSDGSVSDFPFREAALDCLFLQWRGHKDHASKERENCSEDEGECHQDEGIFFSDEVLCFHGLF